MNRFIVAGEEPRGPERRAPAPAPAPGPVLSEEELEVLRAVARGRPLDAIARDLAVSERTVRRRTRRICEQLRVGTPIEAVVWAVRHRML